MKPLLRFAFAIAFAVPLTCQSDSSYFTLNSVKTFGSTEEPSVNLSGYDVKAVQIRVYHVNDPSKFYEELENTHYIGNELNNPHKKPTLLERLHDWKRNLRRTIRVNLRSQFTESPSAHFEKPEPAEKPDTSKPVSKETYFAQAPVLNEQQLVLSFIQPVTHESRWDSAVVPIRVKDKGLYLVEAVHSNLRAYTILSISDMVMINKVGKTQILSYLVNRQTGEPIPGVKVAEVDKHSDGQVHTTDANGLTTTDIAGGQHEGLRLIAINGKDIAFNDLNTYNSSAKPQWTGYIYTDRPVYRPGDTVHFRGILRRQAQVGYNTPSSESVQVQITDPDSKTIYQKSLTTNSNGIIHDELTIEKSSALGSFYIQVRADESNMAGNFEIQEYKKPEYEVHVAPEKPRVLEGETVKAVIDSKYYFGEPVAGAKVTYSIHRSNYWFPYWYSDDDRTEGMEGEGEGGGDDTDAGDQLNQGEGVLDSDGKLTISVPTTLSKDHQDYTYRIDAGVTDKAGREITGTGWLTATYGTFTIYAQPENYIATPGTTTTVKVSARDYDNNPIATSVHLKLVPWWRGQVAEGSPTTMDVTTDKDGTATANVTVPKEGGQIRVEATASAGGRTIESTNYIWAPLAGSEWSFGSEHTLKIVTDKKTYKKGDKAKILVLAGKDGAAVLVTVEGRDLFSNHLLRAKGGTAQFEYAITADDEPGFYVSAEYIQDGALYQGQKRISVPADDHKLALKITTDKATYLPGQSATYDISATGPGGGPAANTDLSLGVVDEAIYAIRKDETPEIVDFFYGKVFDSVITQSSIDYYFTGEAGTRRMRLAALRSTTKLAQLKPEQLVKPKVRKIFPDTAFWQADLTTDSSGHAKATFAFPDSLTTWRATVRGVAPNNQYGAITAKTIVRKNLILRLAVPRFFVQGDEVVISAIVHNYLQTSKHTKVTLNLEGLDIIGGSPTQEVEIASRDEAKIDWRVKAKQVNQAKLTSEALTNEESDALELTLPINPPGIPLHEGKSGSIAGSGTSNVTFMYPNSAITGSRSMSIRLSPSVAGSIFSALDFLTSFPYGCVEQTMSGFLPDIMVQKSISELGLKKQVDESALHEKISAGLERLYNFQHPDGGWGWWETDETHPFMTAYVVAGLSEAKADGVTVNQAAIDKGAQWIKSRLAQSNDYDPDLRAYMAYALAMAGQSDTAALDKVYSDRSHLTSYGTAILGLALELSKDSRSASLVDRLQKAAKDDGAEANWPATRDAMLDFSADITPESTAYVMKFLSHESPKDPLLPKAALWLVNHRNEGYWWSSTKQTAMVIYGLIDYLKATNELHPDLTATVLVNGQKVDQRAFNSDSSLDAPEILLNESKLQTSANQIQIQGSGKGRLYYSVTATHYSNDAHLEKNGEVSLNLLRDYYRLVPTRTGEKTVYDLQPFQGPATQGDVIAVRLTVTGSDWKFLLVEDPIPAGTEFIEKDNLFEINNKPPWWTYWFSRRELHDDHMALFIRHMYEQQNQYFYLLKVVNPGTFHVSPARVSPMYQPGHLATTEGITFEVSK